MTPGSYEYMLFVVLLLSIITVIWNLSRKCGCCCHTSSLPAHTMWIVRASDSKKCLVQEDEKNNPGFYTVSAYAGTSVSGETFVISATLLIGMLLGLNVGNQNSSDFTFQAKYISFFTLGLVLAFLCPYTVQAKHADGTPTAVSQMGIETRPTCCCFCPWTLTNLAHCAGLFIYSVGLALLCGYEFWSAANEKDEFPPHNAVFGTIFGLEALVLFLLGVAAYPKCCNVIGSWGLNFFRLEASAVFLSLGTHMIHDVGVFFGWY